MAISKDKKKEIIQEHEIHKKDTGSPEVQVALLCERISQMERHFKIHKKDHNSRRGLLKLIGERRNLLNYVAKQDGKRYLSLIEKLGLRK